MNDESNVRELMEAGMRVSEARSVSHQLPEDGTPYAVIPGGSQVVSLESLMNRPPRKRARVQFTELPSFVTYLQKHKTNDTVIFTGANRAQFQAVIDYHEQGATGTAGWCEHVAIYSPEQTDELARWKKSNEVWFDQLEFAQFIDDYRADISAPLAADLVEIIKKLEMKKNVQFSKVYDLENGDCQLAFSEVTKTGLANGTMDLPTKFTLKIPLQKGQDPYEIEARLRVRLDTESKSVTFKYQLLHLQKLLDGAGQDLQAAVAKATALDVLVGSRN